VAALNWRQKSLSDQRERKLLCWPRFSQGSEKASGELKLLQIGQLRPVNVRAELRKK
jgi:hypothetical protein